jgi:low temperature requirement protein LtrA
MEAAAHPSLRRTGAHRTVTPLELFFDLVYVFAVGQLSHHLLEHVDLRTGIETALLALAVAYAWYMITWGFNWLAPDRPAVQLMLVGLMFASLLMSTGIAGAFGDRAWQFVLGYVLIQLARTVFLIVALDGDLHRHFVNALVWEVASAALLVAGAFAEGDARLVLFAAAVAVAYVGIALLHALPGRGRAIDIAHSDVAGDHLLERFRLFFILALGESVLVTGTVFTEEPFTTARLLTLGVAFAGSVALWWCYFQRAEGVGERAAASAGDAGAVGLVSTFVVTAMLLALIAVAVGDELAIAHPGDEPWLGFSSLVFGGPALFLLAQLLGWRALSGRVPASRVVALAALGALALATAPLTLLAAVAAAAAVLVAVAVWDTVAA